MSDSQENNYDELRDILKSARHVVILTGAGVSAESGIPTFRGSEGLWRNFDVASLATMGAFQQNPSLVWEFHHFARELVFSKQPNLAHLAIATFQNDMKRAGKEVTVVTQNVDGLHQRAGSENVIELHGSLYKTKCLECLHINYNADSPICPALAGRGDPDKSANFTVIPEIDLPRCKQNNCNGLLRPFTVWFGEALQPEVLQQVAAAMRKCDACLVVGTSSVVYPAAMFAPVVAQQGIPVAEFNMEETPVTRMFRFHFQGPCTQTIPLVLNGLLSS